MFLNHDINGEQGLIMVLEDQQGIQNFHIGMLATHPNLGTIPLQCTYIEGKEAIYYNTSSLISANRYISDYRAQEISWLIRSLGKTIQELIDYQLYPENICFDSQYIFVNPSKKKVYVIYIPIKTPYCDPKEKISNLLKEWIEKFVNGTGTDSVDADTLFLKLLMAIGHEGKGFSAILKLMTEQDDAPDLLSKDPIKEITKDLVIDTKAFVKDTSKDNFKKENQLKIKLNINWQNKRLYQVSTMLICGVSIVVLITRLKVQFNTKLGIILIITAGITWWANKLNLFETGLHQKEKKEKELTNKNDVLEPKIGFEVITDFPQNFSVPIKAEETVWIDPNQAGGFLTIPTEGGTKFYTICKEITSIGRNPSICDILIEESGVGRVHAEIHKSEDKYYLKDIQSLNGSYVNGRKITTNQYYELNSGDQIKIGNKEVIFTV